VARSAGGRPQTNTCWKPGLAEAINARWQRTWPFASHHRHHAVVDCSSSAIISWRLLKYTMFLNLPLQAMPSMQTAPVSSHRLRSINSVDPHSTSRGRRQLEHERSSDPLTERFRLDARGDALRGKVILTPLQVLNEAFHFFHSMTKSLPLSTGHRTQIVS